MKERNRITLPFSAPKAAPPLHAVSNRAAFERPSEELAVRHRAGFAHFVVGGALISLVLIGRRVPVRLMLIFHIRCESLQVVSTIALFGQALGWCGVGILGAIRMVYIIDVNLSRNWLGDLLKQGESND